MIFQYQDEDSGEACANVQTPQSLLCIEKIESSNRFWMLFHGTMNNIAAAVLRHAEFPEVRQSQ